jgi:hypothetical protein
MAEASHHVRAQNEYRPQPRACEDFAFIAQRLREIDRDKAEARAKREQDAPEAWT